MKLEFSLIGDGTNIQVALLEMLGEMEVVRDRFYSIDHQVIFAAPDDHHSWYVEPAFEYLEERMKPPIIGGNLGHLHPYWAEREAVRKRRLKAVDS